MNVKNLNYEETIGGKVCNCTVDLLSGRLSVVYAKSTPATETEKAISMNVTVHSVDGNVNPTISGNNFDMTEASTLATAIEAYIAGDMLTVKSNLENFGV